MAEPYNIHIRTTGDPSGAELTQDALEQTALAGRKIVDAVTKGDRATEAFVADLKKLTPEQLAKVHAEMNALAGAEEAAGRNASVLRTQLQRVAEVNLETQKKNAAGLFSSIAAGTLAATAITEVTRALAEHLRQSIALADQLDDLSGRAGIAASELQRIGNTASQNKGSIQGTADAISKLQISAEGAIGGSKNLTDMFQRLGISSKDLRELKPDELFYKIADAVHTSSDRGRTYADVIGVMGRSSKDLFTTLELGGDQIRATGDAIGVFSDETIKNLAKAKDSIEAFQNKLTIAAGQTIDGLTAVFEGYREYYRQLTLTEPEIQKLAQAETDAAIAADEAKKASKGASDGLDEMGGSANAAADQLERLQEAFSFRAIKDFPILVQLDLLKFKLERLHDEASREVPAASFKSAAELLAAATQRFGKDLPEAILKTAQRYAALEDQVRALAETEKNAAVAATKAAAAEVIVQGDLIKQLRALTAESAKPNLSVEERIKLLEQELGILEKIKKSEEERRRSSEVG
jgi:hypothetical protein